MTTIEERYALILKLMGIPEEQTNRDISFSSDLNFGKYQYTCLAFYIGMLFRINIREKDYNELETIGSTLDFIKLKLEAHLSIQ